MAQVINHAGFPQLAKSLTIKRFVISRRLDVFAAVAIATFDP